MAIQLKLMDKINGLRCIKRLADRFVQIDFEDQEVEEILAKADYPSFRQLLFKKLEKSLAAKGVLELRQIASAWGIKYASRKSKEELLELIREAQAAADSVRRGPAGSGESRVG